jgi:hypothetical protein
MPQTRWVRVLSCAVELAASEQLRLLIAPADGRGLLGLAASESLLAGLRVMLGEAQAGGQAGY